MNGPDYYIPAAALGTAFACKLPALRHAWRDPLLRSVCALLGLAAATFFFAAPPTIAAVNRITGIVNVSAPLVYAILTAFSCSCLVLIVNWRGVPSGTTGRVNRRWIIGFGVVIVAVVVLFALGDAPVERLRDLDTYYATTPYIREMIVLYLAGDLVAAVAMTTLCWRWSLRVHGWLRTGLVIIVCGSLFNLAYAITKSTAVLARWTGHDLDYLSTLAAPPIASVGALLSAVGFVLPLAGQRLSRTWSTWSTYRRLGPLWLELRAVAPTAARPVRIAWWAPAELRLTQRQSDIHDGILQLGPYLDAAVHTRAHAAALEAGAEPGQAHAVADAAMVAAAVEAKAADPDGAVVAALTADAYASADGPRDLVLMSSALRNSSIVAAARSSAGPEPESSHP